VPKNRRGYPARDGNGMNKRDAVVNQRIQAWNLQALRGAKFSAARLGSGAYGHPCSVSQKKKKWHRALLFARCASCASTCSRRLAPRIRRGTRWMRMWEGNGEIMA